MRHVADGVLRRLEDEPLTIPDRVVEHVARCERCSARRVRISGDREYASRLMSSPQLVPDVDAAWSRFQRGLQRPARDRLAPHGQPTRPTVHEPGRRLRFPDLSLRAGLAAGAATIAVVGTAAAASLTTIFAPTHVAPVKVSQSDLQSVAAFMGVGGTRTLGGFPTPSGSRALRFGVLTWSSSGSARQISTLSGASAAAGFAVPLPTRLPGGVGAVQSFAVQPRVSATVKFNASDPSVSGSTVELNVGPAVLAQYGGRSGNDVPTLLVATMKRPTASSAGATLNQVEAFLLSRPGIPSELAEEIRLLGNLGTTLPVPVPAGAAVRSVQIGGWPGVLLSDRLGAAAVAVWEDGDSMLHAVAGFLDPSDVLSVARQLP